MKKTLALLLVVLALVFLTAPIVIASTVADPVQAPVVEIAAEEPVIEEGTPVPTETDTGGIPGFLTWELILTYAGSVILVGAATQFTKGLRGIEKIPTQVWSWVVAMVGLYLANYFTGKLTPETAAIVPINALIVALTSNGGFEGLKRLFIKT